MKGAAKQWQRISGVLNPIEWLVVLGTPLLIVVAIRFLAAFYIGISILSIMSCYIVLVAWDYNRAQNLKKQDKRKKVTPRFHFQQTLRYSALALVLAFIYLSF